VRSDEYRRRRRCLECVDPRGKPRTWPTLEGLDRARFLGELTEARINPDDLGLDPAA